MDEVSGLNIIFREATLYEYLKGSRGRVMTQSKPPKVSPLTGNRKKPNNNKQQTTAQIIQWIDVTFFNISIVMIAVSAVIFYGV